MKAYRRDLKVFSRRRTIFLYFLFQETTTLGKTLICDELKLLADNPKKKSRKCTHVQSVAESL